LARTCRLKCAPTAIRSTRASRKVVDTGGRVDKFRKKYATAAAKA
jgi:hypothetical protein